MLQSKKIGQPVYFMKLLTSLSRKSPYLFFALLVLASVIVLLLNCTQIWSFTIDDAFITFRYSKNVVMGIGPTFNGTGLHAEGYTSFLWMLVMTLPHFLNFGVESFAKLAGILATLGTMACMGLFLWQAGSPDWRGYRIVAAGLVIFILGLLPETAVHAVSGMETASYTLLLTLLVTLIFLAVKGKNWAVNWTPPIALLTGLMRPEANLVAVIMLMVVVLSVSQKKKFLLRVGLFYILPGALYFIWRWSYFGVFFPLPFYLKSGVLGLVGQETVLPFLAFLMANVGLYVGIGLFGERKAVLILLLAALPNIFFFLFSKPIMNYDFRFLYPLLPVGLILAGIGLATLMGKAETWVIDLRWKWVAPVCIALFSILMFLGQNMSRASAVFGPLQEYARGMSQDHHVIGKVLNQIPHTNTSPVLAVTDAGAIPYFSGWNTVDCWGLNDPNIALGRVQPVDYTFNQNPEVLVLSSTDLNAFHNDSVLGQSLYKRAIDRGMQVVVRVPSFYGDSIWVLTQPGGAAAEKLSAAFAGQMQLSSP